MPADQAESTRLRLTFLAILVVSLFVLLFARLWYLQVMAGAEFAGLAEGNAVSTVRLEAPRGQILDRNGEILVENRYAFVVGVQPSELPSDEEAADAVIADLADLLGDDPDTIQNRIDTSRVSPLRPRPVAVDVPEEIILYIWENQSTRYPGVYAELLPQRVYPHGDLAAHVLGYLTEISAKDLETERFADYRAGDIIGRAGVESTYDATLRGSEGLRRLEVDPRGDVIRQLDEVLPTPGADLKLTLDIEVQRAAEEALRLGIEEARRTPDDRGIAETLEAPAGSVVVMDVDTGEVYAIASYPAYRPEEFVGGVSHAYFDELMDPENNHPLINRAIESSYPPGSVYKIVSATAALEHGYVTPNATLPCPARWNWNETVFRNWRSYDSGNITMAQSLVESCNTVYYELARRMWNDEESRGGRDEVLPEAGRQWGFGGRQGIDLPGETSGVVPGREWKRAFWETAREGYCASAAKAEEGSYAHLLYTELCSEQGARWRGGDAVNMSTGQGDVQTTPLQVANAYAAVANGGTLYRPHVALEFVHRDGTVEAIGDTVIGDIGASDSTLGVLRDGLRGVTTRGTASSVFADLPATIAGKTGTAEFGKSRQPYAWFAGYNVEPADTGDGERRYSVVAVVEEGGGGSQTAAPIVRRVFEELLGLQTTEVEAGEPTE
jgi:penicillin-binding protein 2